MADLREWPAVRDPALMADVAVEHGLPSLTMCGLRVMLRTVSSLPLAGPLTLGSGPARFQAGPPAPRCSIRARRSHGEGIGEVLTFAIGVAISPVPIIAVILMLFSQRARVNGPVFRQVRCAWKVPSLN